MTVDFKGVRSLGGLDNQSSVNGYNLGKDCSVFTYNNDLGHGGYEHCE